MGNQATSFSYSLAPSPERHYSGLGTLYGGKKLSTAGKQFPPVSVFVMESGDGKGNLYAQEIKRLRCPDIVRFLDLVLMDQKIWLVTEAVMPFEAVKESLTYAQSILCIERMFHALSFLHSKAHLSHNNISIASIFVHRIDEMGGVLTFKLGGLESCSGRPSSEGKLSTYPQPPESPATGKKPSEESVLPLHCRDIWQMGFVMPQVLSGHHDGSDAVERLAHSMKHAEPSKRPSAPQILQDPFFAEDPFLRCFSFLFSFRAHTSASKRVFFDSLDRIMGTVSSRDLKESLMPLIAQTDVIVDVEAEPFWDRLFSDGTRSVKRKTERLDCGVLVSDFCGHILPAVVELLTSPVRARKAAILTQLPRLLPLLPASTVLKTVMPNVLECLKDCETPLCLMAIESCRRLCATWVETKNEEGLHALNEQLLVELRSLALDANVNIRQKVVEVTSHLILMYDRINGLLGIRLIIGALADSEPSVVLVALEALERMKNLMTAVVIVNIVLPGLTGVLMHKNEAIRLRCASLISFLAGLVGATKDTRSWPDIATSNAVGSTRRKNFFLGSLVEVNVTAKQKEEVQHEGEEEEEEGSDWSAWKSDSKANSTTTTSRAELFVGLQLKKSPGLSRATEVAVSKDPSPEAAAAGAATRNTRSRSEEVVVAVSVPEKKKEDPVREAAVFVVPSPRHARADVPAKMSIVLPPPISPPNKRRAQELDDLLKKKESDSEEEKESVVLGSIVFDDEDEDGSSEESEDMMSLVLQSQKMRSDIIAGGGAVAALPQNEKKKKKAPKEVKKSMFDLPEVAGTFDEEGGWGEDEIALPDKE